MRLLLFLVVCGTAAAGQADQAAHAMKNPLGDHAEAIDAGKARFANACAACHGAKAEGGRGPNLVESDRVRRMTDDELFNTIRRGVPGGGMPAFPLADNSIWEIAAFLRSLSTPAFLIPLTGDVRAGSEVYKRAQCGSCHMISGKGGFLGPDLTDIASSLTLKQLTEAVVSPGDQPVDGFTGVTVTLKDGKRISGVAKNYSNYAVDILDAQGSLHLLARSQLKDLEFSQKSLMSDSYGRDLSQGDLQNLIAFLSRLAVRPDARPDEKPAAPEEH